MPNRFYNYIANLINFTRANAPDVETNLTSVAAGMALVAGEIDRAVRAQPGDPAMAQLPLKDVRALKALYFDANGDPIAKTTASKDEMNAALAAATAAAGSAASAAAYAAALAGILPAVAGRDGKGMRINAGVWAADDWWGTPTALTAASNGSTLVVRRTYQVDTSGGAFAVNLPVMAAGDWIKLVDIKGQCALNNLTINSAGNGTFRDGDAVLLMDLNFDSLELIRTNTGVIEQ